eukprot:scaffold861_cov123-Isochrysis_galbana.AAC.3
MGGAQSSAEAGDAATKAKMAAAKAKAAAAHAKVAAVGIGKAVGFKGAIAAGGSTAAFMARRLTFPVFVVGSAFGGAAWFGLFEIALSLSKYVLPVPEKRDEGAHLRGMAAVPLIVGSSCFVGWRMSPPMPSPPTSLLDGNGWATYFGRFPMRYVGTVGAASAVVAAVGCRAISAGHAR